MTKPMPRIASVAADEGMTLRVGWRGSESRAVAIDLSGWIATGGDILSPLRDAALFAKPYVDDYGAAIAWNDEDLRIDAAHLEAIAEEQKPFDAEEATQWQSAIGLSNREIADLLHVAPSTWSAYKAGAAIPPAIGMLCRAARRDPLIVQSHYRPRKTGRPRSASRA